MTAFTQRPRLSPVASMLAVTAFLATLTGCVAVGGTVHKAPQPTTGQQLIDLRRALDCGAIDQAEYDRLRQEFVKGCPSE
ncbi:MAG: hypothetical protein JNM94_02920 [Phycisphaerae bacterium]|nr:hypothetical protein [Phycisphaerae bacterium]